MVKVRIRVKFARVPLTDSPGGTEYSPGAAAPGSWYPRRLEELYTPLTFTGLQGVSSPKGHWSEGSQV